MKNILLSLLCACILCMAGNIAFAQNKILLDDSFQNEAVTMEVLESNASSYKVKVQIHGLYDNLVENQSGIFHYLSLGRVGQLSTIGNPALPFICQIIAIPPDASMTVSLDEENWEDIEMGLIYPAQNPVIEKDRQFSMNETTYQQPFLPSVLMMGKESVWRGIRHKGVSVCPFKYYPQENRLSVLQSYTLKVDFTHSKSTALQRVESRFGLFDNAVYEREESALNTRTSNSENYDYLILLRNYNLGVFDQQLFDEKLRQFRIWKALKGYKTKVAYKDTIQNVKRFIEEEKNKGLSYVLLVCNGDLISMSDTLVNSHYIFGDYYYGCQDGNIEAEIPIGRFPINSVAGFENMVNKTIKYESNIDYYPNALLVAHAMGAPYNYQQCCEEIRTGLYSESMSFTKAYGASTDLQGNNATNAYVVNEINSGYNIVNYRGHADTNLWGYGEWGIPAWNNLGECFWSSEINNMDSTTCSIFFCIACNTGNLDSATECMLETFTKSNHGAVAFVGATRPTDTETNSQFNKLLFQKLLNDGVYHLGDLNMSAHLQHINYAATNQQGYDYNDISINALSYICGGDPTLEIWTDSPIRTGATVTSGNGYITINTESGLGNYTVNISSIDGELLSTIHCSTSTCTFPIPANRFLFSIDKHNRIPYVMYYDTISDEISDVTFSFNAILKASPLLIKTYDKEVVVKDGNTLQIELGSGGVEIEEIFEVEKGAKLIIE